MSIHISDGFTSSNINFSCSYPCKVGGKRRSIIGSFILILIPFIFTIVPLIPFLIFLVKYINRFINIPTFCLIKFISFSFLYSQMYCPSSTAINYTFPYSMRVLSLLTFPYGRDSKYTIRIIYLT